MRFFGIDCSFTDEQRAGPTRGGKQDEITVDIRGFGDFRTSHAMLYSARTLVNALLKDGIECEIYGNGLARALLTSTIQRREDQLSGKFSRRGNIQPEFLRAV